MIRDPLRSPFKPQARGALEQDYAHEGVPTLSLTYTPPSAAVGTPYSTLPTTTDGTPPYVNYAVTAGTLPAGLSINAGTGEISGTPTGVGLGPGLSHDVVFTVTVTDSAAATDDFVATITVTVTAVNTSLVLPDAIEITPYTGGDANATGGIGAYTFTKQAGPAWLSVHAVTGALSGTPADSDTGTGITVTVRATDDEGNFDDATDTFDVIALPSLDDLMAAGTVYIAHAAAGLRYPEETSAAYAQCAAAGLVPVEQDIHINADGTMVVSHDPDATYTTTSSSNFSALTEAQIAALVVDDEVWFGVDYPGNTIPLYRTVLEDYRLNFVFFTEIKDGGPTQPVTELQAALIATDQAVVSSFTVGDLADASAAGYYTMLNGLAASVLATAIANGIDFVAYRKDAAASLFTDAIAAGKPAWVYSIERRSERDTFTALNVSGMYTDDPEYVESSSPLATTDTWASQDWMPGMVADKAVDPAEPTAGERGRFVAPDYWGYVDSGVTTYQGCLQGWACPINGDPNADTFQIDFSVLYGAVGNGDQTRGPVIFFCANTDANFPDIGSGNVNPNGMTVIPRKNGTISLFRVDAPNTATLVAENLDGAAIADGTEHRFIIKVTPTKIRVERLDGSGNIVQTCTTGDTTHRGGYFHMGHSRGPAHYRNVTVGAIGVDYWHPFDDATLPKFLVTPDSPRTLVSGVISQLNDLGPNGWHLTQSTAAARPTPQAAGIGTHAAVDFDAVDDHLNFPAGALDLFRNKAAACGFVTYDHEIVDVGATDRILVSFANNGVGSRFALFAGTATTANRAAVGGRQDDGDAFGSAISATARSNQNVMMMGVLDYIAQTAKLYIADVLDQTTSSLWGGSNNSSNTASVRARAGAGIGVAAAGFERGEIGCLALYDSVPSTDLRNKLFGWRAHEDGLTGQLDSGHPYKTTPPINP